MLWCSFIWNNQNLRKLSGSWVMRENVWNYNKVPSSRETPLFKIGLTYFIRNLKLLTLSQYILFSVHCKLVSLEFFEKKKLSEVVGRDSRIEPGRARQKQQFLRYRVLSKEVTSFTDTPVTLRSVTPLKLVSAKR